MFSQMRGSIEKVSLEMFLAFRNEKVRNATTTQLYNIFIFQFFFNSLDTIPLEKERYQSTGYYVHASEFNGMHAFLGDYNFYGIIRIIMTL